jgi:hypothetical protein
MQKLLYNPRTISEKGRGEKEMERKQRSAFITTRKGFCYLTIKIGRRNFNVIRIRNYMIEAEEKRSLRRRYPDVVFDWKKLDRQLAEKREACRGYRARRRESTAVRHPRRREAFYSVYDPITRTVYADEVPSSARGVGMLLDAILQIDRTLKDAASPLPVQLEARGRAKPRLELVKRGGHHKTRDAGE